MNPIMDIHNWIMDIYKVMDIHIWIVDVHNRITSKYVWRCNLLSICRYD